MLWGGWSWETCRFIGCWDRFVICIDGIIPDHVTTKADKPMAELKRFLKAGNRYWAAWSVELSGLEISLRAGSGGALCLWNGEMLSWAAAWHSAVGYWYLLQAATSADVGLHKSHGKGLIIVEEEPESKGWWVRNLSTTNLRPLKFCYRSDFQGCCILSLPEPQTQQLHLLLTLRVSIVVSLFSVYDVPLLKIFLRNLCFKSRAKPEGLPKGDVPILRVLSRASVGVNLFLNK